MGSVRRRRACLCSSCIEDKVLDELPLPGELHQKHATDASSGVAGAAVEKSFHSSRAGLRLKMARPRPPQVIMGIRNGHRPRCGPWLSTLNGGCLHLLGPTANPPIPLESRSVREADRKKNNGDVLLHKQWHQRQAGWPATFSLPGPEAPQPPKWPGGLVVMLLPPFLPSLSKPASKTSCSLTAHSLRLPAAPWCKQLSLEGAACWLLCQTDRLAVSPKATSGRKLVSVHLKYLNG